MKRHSAKCGDVWRKPNIFRRRPERSEEVLEGVFKSCHSDKKQVLLLQDLFFIIVKKDLNLKKARTVKKNSPGDCFFSKWCADGYCGQGPRSSSRADCEAICCPVTPINQKRSPERASFLIYETTFCEMW